MKIDTDKNLYIVGDSLPAIRLLRADYEGKIKLIYIDPPYNTGNAHVYSDSFSGGNDWSHMMYPRLLLARELLCDSGLIIISIDDKELASLALICDDIFGSDSRLGTFVINSAPNARDYGHIGKMHEYALCYAKNPEKTITYPLSDDTRVFKYQDEKGGFNIHPLYNSNESFHRGNRPNLYYPFYLDLNELVMNCFYKIHLEKFPGAVEIYPPLSKRNSVPFVWRWGRDKAAENLNTEIIGYKTPGGDYRIVQKMRKKEKIIRSIITGTKYTSRRGTRELEEIMGQKVFSFPKPLALIEDFISFAAGKEDIVLDFFSGSGTTAHAVMDKNASDGGRRRFIMVQTPEETPMDSVARQEGYSTISQIGIERIKRCGELIKKQNPCVDTDFEIISI